MPGCGLKIDFFEKTRQFVRQGAVDIDLLFLKRVNERQPPTMKKEPGEFLRAGAMIAAVAKERMPEIR